MMKRLLTRFVFFLTIFGIAWVMVAAIIYTLVDDDVYFRLPAETRSLILGHSQAECAFNDSLIGGCRNFAQSGESYFYTYYKAKRLLEANPQIETVFLSFSNNQVRKAIDGWIYQSTYLNNKGPRYAPFYSIEDRAFLLSINPGGYLKMEGLGLKKNLHFLLLKKPAGSYVKKLKWGGYLSLKVNKLDSLAAVRTRTPHNADTTVSVYNIRYLKKIIGLCKQHDVRLVLVRSPLHSSFPAENETQFQAMLQRELKEVPFLDFKDFPLGNEEFADEQHLNRQGAAKFSRYFRSYLSQATVEFVTNSDSMADSTPVRQTFAPALRMKTLKLIRGPLQESSAR